jgi:hypothetical protein
MEPSIFLIIEVMIIVIALFVIYSIVRMWAPGHLQVAFANAELLRTAIDDVCAGSSTATIDFDFPQQKPLTFGYFGMGPMPKMMIEASGDPNYLIYYDNFPPGEAYAWEVYMTQVQRSVDFIMDKSWAKYTSEVPFAQANVVLGNNESFGNWTEDFFRFSAYALLPDINKSMIKYRMCGADTLCLKTKDGIYRLPLPSCKGRIDGIQLFQDWSALQDQDEQFDFYLASPCSAKLTIEKTQCGCGEWSGSTTQPGEDDTGPTHATTVFDIPVFKADQTGLSEIGRTKRCFHRIGNSEQGTYAADEIGFDCIRIKISDANKNDDFCFSSNDVEATVGSDMRVITAASQLKTYGSGRLLSVFLIGTGPGKEKVTFTSIALRVLSALSGIGSGSTLSWAWPYGMAFE